MPANRLTLWAAITTLLFAGACGQRRERARNEPSEQRVSITEEALLGAVKESDLNRVNLLLDAGITPDARNANQQTALMSAALLGSSDIARALIDAGADVNARTDQGETP